MKSEDIHPVTNIPAKFMDKMSPQRKGQWIQYHRKRIGIGPVELARRLGVTYPTVYRWEHGMVGSILTIYLEAIEQMPNAKILH